LYGIIDGENSIVSLFRIGGISGAVILKNYRKVARYYQANFGGRQRNQVVIGVCLYQTTICVINNVA
jgi:hypothetical protein